MRIEDVKTIMLTETPVRFKGVRYVVKEIRMKMTRDSRTKTNDEFFYYTLYLRDLLAPQSYMEARLEEVDKE